MDIGSGHGYPASNLSNFQPYKFEVDGIECNSMEGFLQSLKFKEENIQEEVCKLVGKKAKFKGKKKKWFVKQELYWKGKIYKRDSKEYQELLDKAYNSLAKNKKFQKTLLATQNATLTHSIGKNKISETILTKKEFCSRLNLIRKNLQADKDFYNK